MGVKDMTDFEEQIERHQMLSLCVGIFIVMGIAWMTLPSKVDQLINKECAKQCMELMEESPEELGVLKGSTYFEELGTCHTACTRSKRETNESRKNKEAVN
jgi:hypothetical protein